MEPSNGAPPAPPPMTPSGPSNPYDFLQDKPKPKRSFLHFPSGGSKIQRMVLVAVGAVLLIGIGLVFMTILNAPSRAAVNDLMLAAQQQQELIRVADIGVRDANSPDTKNLAVNSKLTLVTDQIKLKAIVNKAKKIDEKTLALGRDTATDRTLTTAKQSNRFDEVFATILKKELLEYQQMLKRVQDNTSSKVDRQSLSEQMEHISLLISSIPGE
jgi:hypothetical protein